MNKYNPFLHSRFHVYLLQLENYHISRFLDVSRNSFDSVSGDLILGITWTSKLKVVVLEAFVLQLIVVKLLSLLLPEVSVQGFVTVILFLASFYIFYVFLAMAVFLTLPLDRLLKKRYVAKAKNKLKGLPNLKVVGITGSYGKTTMKEIVAGALEGSLSVVGTEENKNTPLGISRQVLSKVSESTDVFVVEMGAYVEGDIRELVELVSPSIVILTGINEAHLERQGSIENTIKTKFEIVKYAPKGSLVILNQDDKRVLGNANKYVREDQSVCWYTSEGVSKSGVGISGISHGLSGVSFDLKDGDMSSITVKTRFLASYIVGNVMASYFVAKSLGVRAGAFAQAISRITPPQHRLSISENRGVTIIDDSYNGNPDGVREAIKVLSKIEGRRRIYVTPGLVEMGSETHKIHKDIGVQLSGVADVVFLVENSVTPFIKEGLLDGGFDSSSIFVYTSTDEAHKGLKNLLKEGDVVLFQNDWPENYM